MDKGTNLVDALRLEGTVFNDLSSEEKQGKFLDRRRNIEINFTNDIKVIFIQWRSQAAA